MAVDDCVPVLPEADTQGSDEALAAMARALAHPLRVHILRRLSQQAQCICADMVNDLALPQSTVSQHLKVLKNAGLVSATASGRTMCYCINHQGLRHLRTLIVSL
ncbi:MAG: ArsR family transcriptional regulator [Planctomycetota bacterium]|nr:MAG: ArsR family transcriptional regulator [Planctomycetota bacterium]